MKKFFSYLLAVSASYTFSFWKMDKSGVFKGYNDENPHYTFISKINNIDFKSLYYEMASDGSDRYLAYIYDKHSGYGWYTMGIAQKNNEYKDVIYTFSFSAFSILNGMDGTDFNAAKKGVIIILNDKNVVKILQPKAFLIGFDKEPESIFGIHHLIEKNRGFGGNPLANCEFDFKLSREYISASEIKVMNTEEGVKLSRILEDGTEKVIDFQESLKNYVRKNHHHSFGESLFQPVLKFIEAQKTKVEGSHFKEILDKSKVIFTDQEKELLENSEILAVWHLAPTTYTTKDYRDHEKELDPSKEVKAPETKIVNRILIGWAIDKRTEITFHWVTDLGTDIDVLFEDQYASIISKKVN